MDTATRVQILDEADCISHNTSNLNRVQIQDEDFRLSKYHCERHEAN